MKLATLHSSMNMDGQLKLSENEDSSSHIFITRRDFPSLTYCGCFWKKPILESNPGLAMVMIKDSSLSVRLRLAKKVLWHSGVLCSRHTASLESYNASPSRDHTEDGEARTTYYHFNEQRGSGRTKYLCEMNIRFGSTRQRLSTHINLLKIR